MSIHPDGSGTGWSNVESVDINQPHGKDYLYSQHIAKGIRKRAEQEHSTFADNTVGFIHKPGGAAVLGESDGTPGAADGTYRGHGLVWDLSSRLWCSTAAAGASTSGDFTVMTLHPDKQWKGGDVTWAGAHEFAGTMSVAGIQTLAVSPVFTLGVVANNTYLQGRNVVGNGNVDIVKVNVSDEAEFGSTVLMPVGSKMSAVPAIALGIATKGYVDDEITSAVAGAGFFKADGSTVFNTTMTAANTFQDLDLSAKVGSNVALVVLEIKGSATGAYAAKPKGYGSATFTNHIHGSGFATGGSSFHPEAADKIAYMTIATDANGVIQHGAVNNTTTYTVKLVGYIA